VINDSWTCPESEGCEFDTLREVVENTRAAGILVVASAGNAGSACATVTDPPAIYEAAFSVGATDSGDGIASFSSRGPVTVDGSNRLKPEVSAPGVNVRSSVRGGGYAFFSGTSMAGPHVVGLAALIMSARPDLIGQVEALETIIEGSAFPLTSGQSCGGYSGSSIPNAVFGHGRVDALEALLGDADGDGADNLGDCLPVDGTVWGAPEAVDDLRLGNGANATLEWSAPASAGAAVVRYDVVRSTAADDFSQAHASCLLANSTAGSVADTVAPGDVFYYLVRARTLCGSAVAPDSAGDPRNVRTCLGTGGG
jgi:subtilisin family serine protease